MRVVNRAAVIVRPKEPYIRWAASIDEEAPVQVKELEGKVSIYLVPESRSGQGETAPLKSFFQEIFELELESWYTDEDAWPEVRDLRTFRKWFDIIGESLVVDLGSGDVEIEEL